MGWTDRAAAPDQGLWDPCPIAVDRLGCSVSFLARNSGTRSKSENQLRSKANVFKGLRGGWTGLADGAAVAANTDLSTRARQPASTCNSCSRGSVALFWLPLGPALSCAYSPPHTHA